VRSVGSPRGLPLVVVIPAIAIGTIAGCAQLIDLQDAEVDPALESEEYGASSASGAASPECEAYCASVMSNCVDAFAVYKTADVCLHVCAALPAGSDGDEVGNSVACRKRSAELAPAEPGYYCPAAGPGGNGLCGTNCEGLCALEAAACTGENDAWGSAEACLADCAAVPDLGTYSVAADANMYSGNHVQCRLSHASSAAVADADAHCRHAAGDKPCSD
jgi:hypothetical protein